MNQAILEEMSKLNVTPETIDIEIQKLESELQAFLAGEQVHG